jgi:hypothetical protein
VRIALALSLVGCSFVGIHYPPDRHVHCLTPLPIADTVGAAAAFGFAGYRYAVETHTSPLPLSMVVVGAWATASAIYGYRENARCSESSSAP